MNFANSAFRTAPPSKVSNDTMSHTNMVMACRFGWSSTPETGAQAPQASAYSSTPVSSFNNVRTKRFAPCQGRLYHQLLCSHRIRTDLVEDCGANCVEPYGDVIDTAFICNECVQAEAAKIWEARVYQHNASYPPIDQMKKEQYDQWYAEHRQLEAEFSHDHHAYLMDLKAKTRPSNICSIIEASKEETDFATELDSLSLSLMNSDNHAGQSDPVQPLTRTRTSLPSDASEQLHWNLNSLALDRGACSMEYPLSHTASSMPVAPSLDPEELWKKPRDRN
ncbi:hypothetical protein IAQ61_005034 [Plenodomus lingam]|uniref:Uncharacterized protein n=1 Tax=Leptosphaeria maculans (strain JN3 / isolate v23.1.3 / race Av1-4-5-6-7-8) TaxID=985895 RepID=M1ZMF8_LEPMJ|nr:hypothetical protein IAQ61_005034 [Plenodomus lingam]CCT61148.1 hypothetical protein [Plenodomus lingam JN3]